ncbi:histidine phosphatase family protein [Thermoleptolyngbya oregonensis NK1-22]|uniref:Histidine phosphatase family protein n=1 Tax=Thermoleptolyngbya oregonensis NK1-22 TaxID=2547457 RepID=A0AA96YSV2_9CYAN|nr:histidine phosphatase family protein [Thermoleptolyngbya oregonensis NK1-22]
MATRVILVRHGISTYNTLRRIQGHFDESTLTDEGREAARLTGLALRGLPFAAIYASPLQRARETAEILTAQLENPPALQLRDDLKEINMVEWEGLPFDEVKERFPESYRHWQQEPEKLKMRLATPEGEQEFFPVVDLYRQAEQFWRDTLPQHAGETILLVAHSGINRALIGTAVGLGPADYHALNQANCAISVLNFAGGFGEPVQLESVNLVDHLGKPLPDVRGNHRGPRMLLVRHGETDWNREKRFQGQIDVPLNENGRIQGEKAAFFLKDIPIDRAITSPMLRPKETAELILQFHPDVSLETDDRLKEISHGLWEGKLEEEIQEVYADELAAWKVTPETVQMPAGENLQQVWERAIAAWNEIVASSTGDSQSDPSGNRPLTVLVVAHDAVNKAILSGLMGWGPEKFWVFKQGNGAVTVIDYPRGPENRPMLQSLNITTHLGSGVLDKTAAGAL